VAALPDTAATAYEKIEEASERLRRFLGRRRENAAIAKGLAVVNPTATVSPERG